MPNKPSNCCPIVVVAKLFELSLMDSINVKTLAGVDNTPTPLMKTLISLPDIY